MVAVGEAEAVAFWVNVGVEERAGDEERAGVELPELESGLEIGDVKAGEDVEGIAVALLDVMLLPELEESPARLVDEEGIGVAVVETFPVAE